MVKKCPGLGNVIQNLQGICGPGNDALPDAMTKETPNLNWQ
eukprot:IDg15456t1